MLIIDQLLYVRQNGVDQTLVVASNTAACAACTVYDVCGENADKPKRRSAQQDWQHRSARTATGQRHQTAKLLFCIVFLLCLLGYIRPFV